MAVMAVAMAVAGCGNLPRPFSPENKTIVEADALLPRDGAGVVVDEALCPAAGGAMIEALNRLDIPATAGPGNRGSMRLVCDGDAWRLIDADNARLGDISFDSPDRVAQGVLTLLGRDAFSPADNRLPALVVAPVIGAPGDGETALTRAMALALKGRGVDLAQEFDDTALVVVGSVVISDHDPGSQFVEVIWELLSPDGTRLGIVSQENTIDTGVLDGPWGSIAPVIASAGAEGVIDLIDRTFAP